jgi:hypothetical protein
MPLRALVFDLTLIRWNAQAHKTLTVNYLGVCYIPYSSHSVP